MRVVVVSPETSYHRTVDVTHRLERLVVGLADAGHDVTVLTTAWWEADETVSGTDRESVSDRPASSDSDGDASADATDRQTTDDGPTADPVATSEWNEESQLPQPRSEEQPVATDGAAPARDKSHPVSRDSTAHRGEDDGSTRTLDGVTYRALVDAPGAYRGFLARVPTRIARLRPDIVHANAARPGTVVAARAGGTLCRAPVIAEWYDATDADAEQWTVRQAVRRPARVVAPSRLVSRQLRELGAQEADVRVIPDAIRLDDVTAIDPEGGSEIVYARRLDEAANLESLLLGLAELRDYEWSATVVGDGPARAEYEQQVRDLRIDDRVEFAGACDREERIAIYRDSHVFAQTARRCPFATELLWALACGCVGIVEYHADSSAHELVEGRDRGFRTTTPQEMAEAIQSAGDLDRLTVDESFGSFDESAVVERYLDCYESVTERYGLF